MRAPRTTPPTGSSGTQPRSCPSSATTSRPSRSSRARSTTSPGTRSPSGSTSCRPSAAAGCRTTTGGSTCALLRTLAPKVSTAAQATAAAERDLAPIDPDGLFSPVGKAAAEVQERVTQLNSGVQAADSATRLLPGMLGGDGARTYLLVVQNNAEIRSTGGLPGSLSFLQADDGKVRLGFRGSAADFPPLAEPVLPLSPGELDIYGPSLGKDVRDANLTPDFPRTGQLLSAIVAREKGQKVDGVVSVDPIALSQVLRATGPLRWAPRPSTPSNVVAKLLNESYQRLPTQDLQNAYFAGASRDIANALLSGRADEQALVRAAGEAVASGGCSSGAATPSRAGRPRGLGDLRAASARRPVRSRTWGSTSTTTRARRWSTSSDYTRQREVPRVRCQRVADRGDEHDVRLHGTAAGKGQLGHTWPATARPTTQGQHAAERAALLPPAAVCSPGSPSTGSGPTWAWASTTAARSSCCPLVLKPGQRATVDASFRSRARDRTRTRCWTGPRACVRQPSGDTAAPPPAAERT